MKAVFGIVLVALTMFSFAPPGSYNVGDTVADFSLKNVDGRKMSLSSFKANQGVILIFDCNTCPTSKAYNNRILALAKKYEKIFPVVLINANDPEQSPGDSFE